MAYILYFSSMFFVFAFVNGEKFGYGDRYTCHCQNNSCDKETGFCDNNDCIQGWFGPTCQKENVALLKPTVQSSQYEDFVASLAVDGNTDNENNARCSHTALPDVVTRTSYWQVDLGEIYPIRDIKIYLRDPFAQRLRGYFINTVMSNGTFAVCKSPSSQFIPGLQFTVTVNCEGQFVRISNTDRYNPAAHVNLCELEIYVCAPGTYGTNCENFCYCKSVGERCTDGVCPSGCIPGFTNPSCSAQCYGSQCRNLCENRKCKVETSSCDINTGRCNGGCQIGYQQPDCQFLCSSGSYGDQCLKQCSDRLCLNLSPCDAINGECIGGCLEGYTGTDCTEVCGDGRYGRNCQHLCRVRNCKGETEISSCDSKSGKCDSGCILGYKPPNCIERCDYNINYGDQCSRNCSDRHCYYPTSACDRRTGDCYNSQCETGYKPGDCYDKCDKDISYGAQCLKVCSQRNCSDTSSLSCDHVTGKCDSGCKPGYRLEDCSEKCSFSYYGKWCNKKCSERNCKSYSRACDYITGECPDGCRNNYVGIDCTEKCSPGSYGDGCTKQCKDRQCREVIDELCENPDGTCINGCKAGYMAYDCTQPCKGGYYGENCNKSCQDRKCNNEGDSQDSCNPESGVCEECLPGYIGTDCTTQCSARKYGMNCQYDCDKRNCINNTHCNFTSGFCDGGCLDGFENVDCVLGIKQKGDNMSVGAVVGIIVAALCIIIMAGIVFIVFRKRRLQENIYDKSEENTGKVIEYNQISREDLGPIYENSPTLRNIKSETMPQKTADKSKYPLENQSKTLKPNTAVEKDPNNKVRNIESKQNTDTLKNVEAGSPEVEMESSLNENQKENNKTIKTGKVNSDDVYYNLETPVKTNVLQIKKLKEHVARLKNLKSSFSDIYQKLPSGFTSAYEVSKIEENKSKNRFKGYYPYDYNRVILNKTEDDPNSDYINASYVDSYNQRNHFIAAQGPTKITIDDFVRMIFEEKCEKVLMLTNLYESGKYKCERYWPQEDEQDFGNITVKMVEETTRSYYVKRKLILVNKKNSEVHKTTQFHMTAWLDHDVPRISQLLDFLYHVEEEQTTDTPVLVHCSAGIGRTGTYIAIDSLLKEGLDTGKIDIQLRVQKMREQRKDMIQTSDQLKFVFEALAEAFESGRTDVSVEAYEKLLKSENKSFSLTKLSRTDELKLLQDTENKVEKSRIFIQSCPNLKVYRIMSWKNPRGYFISDLTGHDKNTIWNLIMEEECETVVYFNEKAATLILPDSNQEDVGKYKLSSSSPTKLHDAIQLHTIQIESDNDVKECKLLIVQTKQLHDNSILTSVLTELVYQVGLQDITQTPVAVFYQTARFAARFCITKNIIERIKNDNEVEILNSTRQILEIIPNAVNNMEDYNFLYNTTSSYIESQSVYENF